MRRLTCWLSGATVVAAVLVASAMVAGGDPAKSQRPKAVTLTGTLVDLQSYMTDNYPSTDRKRSTATRIKRGVPAALETADGLVVIGMNPEKRAITPIKLSRHAHKELRVSGMLYEKGGLKYIETHLIEPARGSGSDELDNFEDHTATDESDLPDEDHEEDEPEAHAEPDELEESEPEEGRNDWSEENE